MSLINTLKPLEEEITINNIMSLKQRPKPEIISSEAFYKSIAIISKYDYKLPSSEQIIIFKKCSFCKNEFPTIEGKNILCNNCGEYFCVNHRNVINHNCEKMDANKVKILAAKNLFKERMRLLKLKGH